MRLTTSQPSVSRLSRKCGASTSHNPMGLHGLLQGQLYLFFYLLSSQADPTEGLPSKLIALGSSHNGTSFLECTGTDS
jgi:hypothetical protein